MNGLLEPSPASVGSGRAGGKPSRANSGRISTVPFVTGGSLAGDRDRLVEVGQLEDVVAAELLCRFRERAIGDQGLAVPHADGRGGRHRLKRRRRQRICPGRRVGRKPPWTPPCRPSAPPPSSGSRSRTSAACISCLPFLTPKPVPRPSFRRPRPEAPGCPAWSSASSPPSPEPPSRGPRPRGASAARRAPPATTGRTCP